MGFLKQFFCKHDTDAVLRHKYYPSRLWIRRCKKCGAYFFYDKFDDRMVRQYVKDVNIDEWDSIRKWQELGDNIGG